MEHVEAELLVGLMVVCAACFALKAESQSPVRLSSTGGQTLERWMKHSRTVFRTMTNDNGRVEFDVSLWDMGEVYPTLTVKLYAEEDYVVSRCELPVFILKEHYDALVRLFDGRMAQAPAFTYKLDRAKGRAWCESTTPMGLCGDPLHCDDCRRRDAGWPRASARRLCSQQPAGGVRAAEGAF